MRLLFAPVGLARGTQRSRRINDATEEDNPDALRRGRDDSRASDGARPVSDATPVTSEFSHGDHAHALLNILEDFAEEKVRLQETQRAVLNILDDANVEKQRLRDMQKAVLNILDDLDEKNAHLEATQNEVLRSEQVVRASLREKEVLLKEIHHRVKNNLQVISSLLNLQARHLVDPAARDIFNESQNRVLSIALVHEKLYQSASLSHVNFGDYTAALLENLFYTYNTIDRRIAKVISVDVDLPIDLAIPCGLIINELTTNSLKHAFPAGRPGTIRVLVEKRELGAIELIVADDGVGMPAGLDPRKTDSVGLDLVFIFAKQLHASVEVDRHGGTSFRFLISGETRS
jgi:two-component sensor histidine kinase